MNKIDANLKIEINSGVWNTPDVTAIISTLALSGIAICIGVLGALGHQGVNLSSLNAISTCLPNASCALIAGVGGSLICLSVGIFIYKFVRNKSFKKRNLELVPSLIRDKNHALKLNEYKAAIDHVYSDTFNLFTVDQLYIFGSVEALASRLHRLEKQGYQNCEKCKFTDLNQRMPLSEESRKGHPQMYWLGLTVTLMSLPGFIIPFFFPFPYAWTLQTVALGVLSAVFYGIVNDQIAIRQSKTYFTLGHTSFHKRLLKTDNATANGTIWGIHATSKLGAIAGVVLALVATVTHSCAINPLYMAPLSVGGSLGVNIYAHIKSKKFEHACKHLAFKKNIDSFFDNKVITPFDTSYDSVYLSNVPEEERPGWLAVGKRNNIGYVFMPAMGLVLLIAIIAARIFLAVI